MNSGRATVRQNVRVFEEAIVSWVGSPELVRRRLADCCLAIRHSESDVYFERQVVREEELIGCLFSFAIFFFWLFSIFSADL